MATKPFLALALLGPILLAAAVSAESGKDMVPIEAGNYLSGSDPAEAGTLEKEFGRRDMYKTYNFKAETPRKKVYLKKFYIDKFEVTNSQYGEFVKKTGHLPPDNWQGKHYPNGQDNFAVIYVSEIDASEYCRFVGKRLPTEQEWEKSARGTEGFVYPWGNDYDPLKAATAESSTELIAEGLCKPNSSIPVDRATGDFSPFGIYGMGGNVREWTSTTVIDENGIELAVIKGASWADLRVNARGAHRDMAPVKARSHLIGFRCARD